MSRMTAQEIGNHVAQEWDGVYITRRASFSPALSTLPDGSAVPDGSALWETILRVPDGDKVWTLETPDGTLVDLTRR